MFAVTWRCAEQTHLPDQVCGAPCTDGRLDLDTAMFQFKIPLVTFNDFPFFLIPRVITGESRLQGVNKFEEDVVSESASAEVNLFGRQTLGLQWLDIVRPVSSTRKKIQTHGKTLFQIGYYRRKHPAAAVKTFPNIPCMHLHVNDASMQQLGEMKPQCLSSLHQIDFSLACRHRNNHGNVKSDGRHFTRFPPNSDAIQISGNRRVLPTCRFCQPEADGTALTLECNWETVAAHPNACVRLVTTGARNPE
ncbi:hypothetical protein F2P81_002490 [Scophthalmus maximus]|uniref:Uncharacterized protein n=1 Tax=Scophthalmus maximus TaxID=52904 RepID=A0A6A4TTC7_SCOMX|nr:hypothetical protein F2P81_002490 [Scophthalmus maximus]